MNLFKHLLIEMSEPNEICMVKSVFRIFFLQIIIIFSALSYSQDNSENDSPTDTISKPDHIVNPQPVTPSRLQQMPFRSVNGVALNSPNTYYLKNNTLVVDGLLTTGDNFFIDGMQVTDGQDFPFRAIASYQHYRINQPVEYGNVPGSLIELKTPECKDKFHFDIDGYTTFNKDLKNNVIELNLGGPFRFSKKGENKFVPAFYLVSNYSFSNDPYPGSENKYRVTTETQNYLAKYPLMPTGLASGGTFLNAEFLEQSDIEDVRVHQGADRQALNSFLKLMFPFNKNINLSIGSYAKTDNGKAFVFDNALLNSNNNPETFYRNFDNYLNFDHKIDINDDVSIGYNLNLQYSGYYFRQQDERHKDRYFEYGYLGKFTTYKTPTYQFVDEIEINGEIYENVFVLTSWDVDTAYTFQNLNFNPEAARFTEQIYEFYPDNTGNWQNSDQLQMSGGLLNGQNPGNVYGLWNSQGTIAPYYINSQNGNNSYYINFGNTQSEKYRGTFKLDVNYQSHHFFAGVEYMQKTERSYSIDPMALWGRMRGLTNFHLSQLDLDNPQIGNDTIFFYRLYDEFQFDFDKNLRKKLGLPVDGLDFILTDSYDMINHTIDYYDKNGVMHTIYAGEELYTLDMFSPDELLNGGQYVVRYMGYDYAGNKLKGKQGDYDFYTNRNINAYRPSYFSAYLGDQFSWKSFDISLGLRIDCFNANQPVLKDKYSYYEIYSRAETSELNGNPVSHPDNIGDDYAVYVDNIYSPTGVTGYRSGDIWYNSQGKEINDLSELDSGSGISPYLVNPEVQIGSANWSPDMTFEYYKPSTCLLPQVNIDLRTGLGKVYAYYNSFSQNPSFQNIFRPDEYLFYNYNEGIKNNPALKPMRTDKLSVGVQPIIYKNIYADIAYLGVFVKNNYYIDRIYGAYPVEYTTILNNEEMIPGNNFIIALNYFSPKFSGIGAGSSLTKSFIWNQAKENLNKPDMIINTHLTFNFGYGNDFILSQNKVLKAVFENFGIGVYYQFRSGTKLAESEDAEQNYFETPDFSFFNLRVEKGVYIKPIGLTVSLYIWIENLFDQHNLFYIDPVTGKPDDDGYLSSPDWQQEINNQVNPETYRLLYQYKLYNPAYYDTPRIVRAGLIINL